METEQRESPRQRMLGTAKIFIGASAVECLALDRSARGIRISNEMYVEYPLDVLVQLSSGLVWCAKRRWQRGLEAGFELVRVERLSESLVGVAQLCRDHLRDFPLEPALRRLEAAGCFEVKSIRASAEAVENALASLDRSLSDAVNGGSDRPLQARA